MISAIAVLIVLSVALGQVTCNTNQVYIKLIKQSQSYAEEESVKIYDGNSLVYTSPLFVDDELTTIEECITKSTNSQYTIKLLDSAEDGWSVGTWLEIRGLYGNSILKAIMITDLVSETYPLSLYYPVEESAQWKYKTGAVPATWNTVSFDHTSWSDVTLGSSTAAVSGTQYLRKTFVGVLDMAAIDLRLKYTAGVIAYINGNEIWRDNMPLGPVTADTYASGSYSEAVYRGTIRGAVYVAVNSVLAVEVHSTQASPQTTISLNAWLGLYASSNPDATAYKCYVIPTTLFTSTTNEGDEDGAGAYDWSVSSRWTSFTNDGPYIDFAFSLIKPVINGLSIYTYSQASYAPTAVSVTNANGNVITASNLVNTANKRLFMYGLFNDKYASSYRMYPTGTGFRLYVFEMHYYACNVARPTSIVYNPSTFSGYSSVDTITIRPIIDGFTNCSVTPALPTGLTLDVNTCLISGIPTQAISTTTFNIQSTLSPTETLSGSFTLTILACNHPVISVKRVYGSYCTLEAFKIENAVTGEVLYDEPSTTTQVCISTWETRYCVPGERYKVTLYGEATQWGANSYLYIYNIVDDEKETIQRIRAHAPYALRTVYYFRPVFVVPAKSEWNYKMGVVPANWYNNDVTGWQQSTKGSFPPSENKIQLYKKIFTVSSLDNVSGVIMLIRYQYGIVVFLNGHEVFRNGVTGDLSVSSETTNSYETLMYRSISLPTKTMPIGSTPSVNYIVQGSNTIAIGLVAMASTQVESLFDAAIRLFGDEKTSRVFDYDFDYTGYGGYPDPFSYNFRAVATGETNVNTLTLTLNNDRRDYISSITFLNSYYILRFHCDGVSVFARNTGEEWTSLGVFSGWRWWSVSQEKTMYLLNNKPYNQFKFENFTKVNNSEDYWEIDRIDLFSDNLNMNIPDLAYESLDAYLNVELAEIYPNSPYYSGFTVTPDLPVGLSFDQGTGAIMGTATVLTPSRVYTITAHKLTGETKSCTMTMAVVECTGGKGLITATFRTDDMYSFQYYKVHQGRGSAGPIVRQEPQFLTGGSAVLVYADFCLADGIYTLEAGYMGTGGWSFPAGFMMTVDQGTIRFDLSQLGEDKSNTLVPFSSYIPFQINFSSWQVSKEDVPANWAEVDYDDSQWTATLANAIGTSEQITTYIRYTFSIPTLADCHVLNAHVRYGGGVAAYFNGHMVARFNLPEVFDKSTSAPSVHDPEVFSRFHVLLATTGATTTNNVIAFELHRASGASSSEVIAFDATGVFGVNDCSPVVDSFVSISGNTPSSGVLTDVLDYSPITYISIDNTIYSKIEWSVENLVGTTFNQFAIHGGNTVTLGYSLYGRTIPSDQYTLLYENRAAELVSRERNAFATPVGIAAFRHFKFEIDIVADTTPRFSTFLNLYCKPAGAVCPAVGDYPSVAEGEISPSHCPDMYSGYSYRLCQSGVLGEIRNEFCKMRVPTNLVYSNINYIFIVGIAGTTGAPTYTNIINTFYFASSAVALPEGMTLNNSTGEISGTPSKVSNIMSYVVYGKNNDNGATSTNITISARMGICKDESVFERTEVGKTFAYECSKKGAYIGTMKRECVLGAKDGEWKAATGFCMSIVILIVIVLVVVVVVAVLVFIIIRISKKKKSVGGVKGKKVTTMKPKQHEKQSKV